MNIQQLLDRFMAGETSLAEEREIAQYFRDHRQVDSELEPYREMFDYFADGMPLEQKRQPTKRPLKWVAAAVAAAAVALLLLFSPSKQTETSVPFVSPTFEVKTTSACYATTIPKPTKNAPKRVKKEKSATAAGKASADSLVREIEMRQENAIREVYRQELRQAFIISCIEQSDDAASQPSNYIEL